MLWKPAAPVYPKLIQEAPEGLTKAETDVLRKKGKSLLPICKLGKSTITHFGMHYWQSCRFINWFSWGDFTSMHLPLPEVIIIFVYVAAKNGVYASLVKDVRDAFEGSPLVKIDCKGMHASDYKKIGAKLKVSKHFFAIP